MAELYKAGQVLKVIDHTGRPTQDEVVRVMKPSREEISRFMRDGEYKIKLSDGSVTYWDLEEAVRLGKVSIEVLDDTTGGRDTSGYEGDNNVYCEQCDTQYRVEVDLDGYVPTWCTFCGSEGLLTKEEI